MKIMTGTPYWGGYDKEHFACVMRLGQANVAPHVLDIHAVQDCAYIDQAKSILATKALDLEFDVVLIIDHDMIFEVEDVIQVCQEAVDRSAVVGAAYGARKRNAERPVAYIAPPVTFFEGGSVVPATIVAGGFVAIPTSVLARLVERNDMEKVQTTFDFMAYPFFQCIVMNEKWWGEDISFCMRAREAGIGLFIDTRLRIGHKGSYVYQLEDAVYSVPMLKSLIIEGKES
jgi:hypothetical protein